MKNRQRKKIKKIISDSIVLFWKISGKEWCGQYMTNQEIRKHQGFKLTLNECSEQALNIVERVIGVGKAGE